MLFIKSHSTTVKPDGYDAYAKDADGTVSMSAACGFMADEPYPATDTAPFGPFNYYFPMGAQTPESAGITSELDALADSMVDTAQKDHDNSDVPAIITYLGQFIDHDITAGTDRQSDFSDVDVDTIAPKDRGDVTAIVANLRTGALDLDSVYGGATVQGEFATEMSKHLRHPDFPAKMRIGIDLPVDFGVRPARPFPRDVDPAHDLLRAERLIHDNVDMFSDDMIASLPQDLQNFLTQDGTSEPNPARAVIGDGRNDENLAVASVHLAFLRLHNRIVDHAPAGSPDAQFEWARTRVRWIYQWLIMNVYLPSVCDGDTLAGIITQNAQLYRDFKDQTPHKPGHMPLPLEFSVAAFRFGHTTARPDYDWNENFQNASFRDLFAFTGGGKMGGFASRLPSNWLPDFGRFLNTDAPADPRRNTRLVDTHLAPRLLIMRNIDPAADMAEDNGQPHHLIANILRNLPRRNLRRGYLLALPTAQACLDALETRGTVLPRLSEAQLRSGDTGAALSDTLAHHTPIWFYILKEAEVMTDGLRLGPLGTHLVAETLVGLVQHGTDTYWHQNGSDNGVWHPRDDVQPSGEPVDSLGALARAALMA